MPSYPVKPTPSPPREDGAAELLGPEPGRGGFVSFSYSCTEISAAGGKARVRSRTTRLADGKLTSESFEGELGRSAYDDAVRNAEQFVIDQTGLLMKSLAMFLPFSSRRRSERE